MGKHKVVTEETPGKKRGGMKLVLGAVLLAGAGAGGTYGAIAAGLLGTHEREGNDGPVLIAKGEADPYAPVSDNSHGEGGEQVFGSGGSKYRTAYYRFEGGFTSNLKNSAGLIQVEIAASTRRDGRVLQWLKWHELSVRSAILAELADTPEEDVYSIEGKERLQKRLTAAANRVLTEREGFGGIDAIYFESFLVQ